jgi:hypothetical protein
MLRRKEEEDIEVDFGEGDFEWTWKGFEWGS